MNQKRQTKQSVIQSYNRIKSMQQDQQKTNEIYSQQIPLRQLSPAQNICDQSSLPNEESQEESNRIKRIQQDYQVFEKLYQLISQSHEHKQQDIEVLCKSIGDYLLLLVKYQKQQFFFQHAVENKFIALLLEKMEASRFASDVVKTVFSALEFLLKAIKKEDQYVYFMVCINKVGFVTANYKLQEDDSAYFANFLKLLTRKINQDQKYLNIFFNQKEPQFPLLLNLLRFHDSKDQILRTSVKLTLIEISSNQSKYIQKFISNFPFVMFYPIFVYQIYRSFLESINKEQTKSEQCLQNLRASLKFMEDYTQNKDRQTIQMYTNCFMTLIGKLVYKELAELSAKNQERVRRLLKVLCEVVIKDVTILKIKIGLGQIFTKYINKDLMKFLKSKTHHIQFNSWLLTQCKQDVRAHCESIFPRGSQIKKSSKSSLMKTFNSYIPRSKDNWLFYQLRKISEMIGTQIQIYNQIDPQVYLNGSYLKAIEQDTHSQQTTNEAYQKLTKYDSQQILFYYIKIVTELKIPLIKQGKEHQHEQNQTIIDLLNIISRVTSLSVIKKLYRLIQQNQVYIDEGKYIRIKHMYENVLQKLVYYILTEGWNSFINRSKIKLKNEDSQAFSPDIFRDLECQILFFVGLRHLLGTKNEDCWIDDEQFKSKDIRRTQTKANCLLMQEFEDNSQLQEPIQIILDGQYIKLVNQQSKSISTQNILINRSHIYESQESNCLQIIQKENSESPRQQYFFVEFRQTPIKNYIWKQIKWRKQVISEIQIKLRLLKFEFIQ